ncbi:MAG: hypothetical protein HOM84_03315 [Thiotrichales bacterium]|nr:hypothetical protein [Thiotrichales bacterium]
MALSYGVAVALINWLWLQWRKLRAEKRGRRDGEDADRELATIYMTALERLVLVTALLFFGMVSIALDPLQLLIGFIVGQIGLIIGIVVLNRV